MHQDSRESAATTIIHRKTQRNEKVKFQNPNKSDRKKRDFHTSHAECPLWVGTGGQWGGGDFIYKEQYGGGQGLMVIIRVNIIVPVILNARCVHYLIFQNKVEKL